MLALNLGELRGVRGIESGIENTNYFVTTEVDGVTTDHVLTLFERLTAAQLPFYLYLMQHLAQRGIPVPDPRANARGDILHTSQGQAGGGGEQAARPTRTAPWCRPLRGRGRHAGAHAPGRARLSPAPAQPAWPALVE